MLVGDITLDSRQPKLGQVVYSMGENRSGRVQGFTEHEFEAEREDTSTVLFEHDPGARGSGKDI